MIAPTDERLWRPYFLVDAGTGTLWHTAVASPEQWMALLEAGEPVRQISSPTTEQEANRFAANFGAWIDERAGTA